MATVEEIVLVNGIRCERCMARLAKVLEGHEGLESANADFQGHVRLTDDERTSRDALLKELLRGGFREQVERT